MVKAHLKKAQVACQCLLCGFVVLKRETLLAHVANNTKHVLLAAKFTILDHRPYLWENPSPHALGTEDYRAYSPEASLLHFLGILNQGSTTTETYCSFGDSGPIHNVHNWGGISDHSISKFADGYSGDDVSSSYPPSVASSVVDQPVCQDLRRPYASTDSAEHSELGLTNIADQLLTL